MRRAALAFVSLLTIAAAEGVTAQPPAADTARRARLEGDVRRLFARAVRQRVGLSDSQMQRLAPVASRYEAERRRLQGEEREARLSLRSALTRADAADSAQVSALLQRLVDVQKRRVQILENEQRDLAGIMTPLQRAKYMALQEQIRRRLELMRQRRMQLREGDLEDAPGARVRPRREPR